MVLTPERGKESGCVGGLVGQRGPATVEYVWNQTWREGGWMTVIWTCVERQRWISMPQNPWHVEDGELR